MDIFSSNFLQNLKLFWQFVGNFDKQCFLIISHKRISVLCWVFSLKFSDSYWIFRFIYWNSHFYGSNFYGWSIGDLKSLTESGPFHSQGEQGEIFYSRPTANFSIGLWGNWFCGKRFIYLPLKADTAWSAKLYFD